MSRAVKASPARPARAAAHLPPRAAAHLLLALLCLGGARAALAQVPGYPDADGITDAVGAMRITIETARAMREECIGRVAALQPEIDANYLKWRGMDAPLIRKAEQYWGELLKKQPGVALQLGAVEPAVRRNLDGIARTRSVPGTDSLPGTVLLSQYCRQHFADLASGIWHVRTPQVYKYLEEAP